MADKQYVGSGKKFGQYDQLKIGIRFADLPTPNERGYINLIVSQMRQPDKAGNTHTVYVDDWTPNAAKDAKNEERAEQTRQGFQPDDDMPF
jgi:hypothetical protein